MLQVGATGIEEKEHEERNKEEEDYPEEGLSSRLCSRKWIVTYISSTKFYKN
jgi:hypothetical protein